MQFDDDIKEIIDKKIGLDKTVLIAYRGSISHNMYIPSTDPNSIDDVDAIVVYVNEPEFYLSLTQGFEKGRDIKVGKFDIVAYELKKFVYLLIKNNPNTITTLWLNHNHYIYGSETGCNLIKSRDMFTSKAIFYSFGGYARSQFKRMSHFKFNGYMGDRRKKLVEKYGYDTKNASHLIRLLRMAKEALLTGKLEVFRINDAENLLDIKRGEWTLEQVKEEAQRLDNELVKAFEVSNLRNKVDLYKINAFLFQTLKDYLNNNII